jgi:hypothetical protein
MNDVTELLDLHQFLDLDCAGLTGTVNVVPGQVDKHNVLGAVFSGTGQLRTEPCILCECPVTKTTNNRTRTSAPAGVLPLRTVPAMAWLYTLFCSTLHSVSGLAPTICISPQSR